MGTLNAHSSTGIDAYTSMDSIHVSLSDIMSREVKTTCPP